MINSKYPAMIFYFVAILALTVPIFFYNSLPEQVGSHFNLIGNVDSWMNKNSFYQTYYIQLLFMIFLFVLINLIIKKVPHGLINIPNKKYWLEQNRKDLAITAIKNFIYLIGSFTIFFTTITFGNVYIVNINSSNNLGSTTWINLSIFIIGMVYLIIKMYAHFNKIENQ